MNFSNLGTAISAGLSSYNQAKHQGEQIKAWKEDRAYQKSQRERVLKEQQQKDSINARMGAGMAEAEQAAALSGQKMVQGKEAAIQQNLGLSAQDASGLNLTEMLAKEDSRYTDTQRPAWAGQGLTAGAPPAGGAPTASQPATVVTTPYAPQEISEPVDISQGVPTAAPVVQPQQPQPTTTPAPAPVQTAPAKGLTAPAPVSTGATDTRNAPIPRAEILKPRMDADSLFYKTAWQQEKAKYAEAHGFEKMMAMDATLKTKAQQNAHRRLMEAVHLDRSGDKAGAVQKWNEIYNRDLPDGYFSTAELVGNDQVRVTRYTADGQQAGEPLIQSYPDMKAIALSEMLTPEGRLKSMVDAEVKADDRLYAADVAAQKQRDELEQIDRKGKTDSGTAAQYARVIETRDSFPKGSEKYKEWDGLAVKMRSHPDSAGTLAVQAFAARSAHEDRQADNQRAKESAEANRVKEETAAAQGLLGGPDRAAWRTLGPQVRESIRGGMSAEEAVKAHKPPPPPPPAPKQGLMDRWFGK
jgi:hypothetical protein